MTVRGKSARQREQAIAALLERPTITEAARAVGIGEKTLRRWLAEPEFQAAYRDAREQAVRRPWDASRGSWRVRVRPLERAMACGTSSVEIRAAGIVIQEAFKGAELLDLAERVAALEKPEPPRGA